MLNIEKIRNFVSYVGIEGALLFGLFYGLTLVLAIAQQYTGMRQFMQRLRRAKLGMGNVYAAVVGAPMPFCACSTIPVLSGMLRMHIRFGICITFLMASPIVNEAVVIVMGRYFGLTKTGFYILLGVFFPIIAGIVFDLAGLGRFVKQNIEEEIPGEVVSEGRPIKVPFRGAIRFAHIAAVNEVRTIFFYLLSGLVIAGVIHGFISQEWIAGMARKVSPGMLVPVMAVVGSPLSFNLAALIPVAFALTEKGVPFGPLLAFLVAGGALSIPEFFLLVKLFRPPLMVAYAISVILAAIGMGYIFSWIL